MHKSLDIYQQRSSPFPFTQDSVIFGCQPIKFCPAAFGYSKTPMALRYIYPSVEFSTSLGSLEAARLTYF